jgi:hypothetical protein
MTDQVIDIQVIIKAHLDVYTQKAPDFCRTFGVPLKRFWENHLLGFDIVAFDDFVGTPAELSLAEHVQEKYGQDACNLIEALLNPLGFSGEELETMLDQIGEGQTAGGPLEWDHSH